MDGVNINKLCVVSIIFIVHLCFGSHSHGQFLKSIRSTSIKESRRGSRENPDRFTDNRAPKAQESRGVWGHAPR